MSTSPPEIPDNYDVLSRRGKFYHETIILEVEGVLHRVYRYGFEKWSHSVFRDMFALPQGDTHCGEGESDENPIKLVGCTNSEFESLLEAMYPSGGLMRPQNLSKQEWIGVLRLSRLWDMPEVASLVIERLGKARPFKLTPTEKITLGKEYGVSTWLKEGYTSLVSDISAISLKDLSELGWETACRLLWVREEIAKSPKSDDAFVIPPGSQIFCSSCYRKYLKSYRLKNVHSTCAKCGNCPVIIEPGPTPDNPIAEMVEKGFEEDLKDAGRHNAS